MKKEENDLDGLNYLAGKTLDFVNKSAMKGTQLAHTDGNVPNLQIRIRSRTSSILVSCSTSLNMPAVSVDICLA